MVLVKTKCDLFCTSLESLSVCTVVAVFYTPECERFGALPFTGGGASSSRRMRCMETPVVSPQLLSGAPVTVPGRGMQRSDRRAGKPPRVTEPCRPSLLIAFLSRGILFHSEYPPNGSRASRVHPHLGPSLEPSWLLSGSVHWGSDGPSF